MFVGTHEWEVEFYETNGGKRPFQGWLDDLKDSRARAKIKVRIDRVSLGNFGQCKSLGLGIYEMKIDLGPGYRVYFGLANNKVVMLLCGGDKSSQKKDIRIAQTYWQDYRSRIREKKKD